MKQEKERTIINEQQSSNKGENEFQTEEFHEVSDRDTEVFMNAKDVKSDVPYLAACIFMTLKSYDVDVERLLYQTHYAP